MRAPVLHLLLASWLVGGVTSSAWAERNDRGRLERPSPPTDLATLARRFLPAYEPLHPYEHVDLLEARAHEFSQPVEAGVCYGFAAAGSGLEDLDIRVSVAGVVVAQDVRLDTYPVVQWCAAASTEVRVEILAFRGDGVAEYGVFVDPGSRAAATGELDELSNRLSAATASAAPRWAPAGSQWRSAFTRPETQSVTIEVSPGRCYAVVAVAQPSVRDVDMLLLDGSGYERSRDFNLDGPSVVTYCPAVAQALEIRIAVTSGAGVVAAQVLEHPQ